MKSDSRLIELLDTQKGYDLLYWKEKDLRKDLRHVQLHLNKMLGKISQITEPYEHGDMIDMNTIVIEVIPDLLIYALHLSTKHYSYPADLEKYYRLRLLKNIRRNEDLE